MVEVFAAVLCLLKRSLFGTLGGLIVGRPEVSSTIRSGRVLGGKPNESNDSVSKKGYSMLNANVKPLWRRWYIYVRRRLFHVTAGWRGRRITTKITVFHNIGVFWDFIVFCSCSYAFLEYLLYLLCTKIVYFFRFFALKAVLKLQKGTCLTKEFFMYKLEVFFFTCVLPKIVTLSFRDENNFWSGIPWWCRGVILCF